MAVLLVLALPLLILIHSAALQQSAKAPATSASADTEQTNLLEFGKAKTPRPNRRGVSGNEGRFALERGQAHHAAQFVGFAGGAALLGLAGLVRKTGVVGAVRAADGAAAAEREFRIGGIADRKLAHALI